MYPIIRNDRKVYYVIVWLVYRTLLQWNTEIPFEVCIVIMKPNLRRGVSEVKRESVIKRTNP